LTVIRPEALAAGPGACAAFATICADVCPPSFFAFSATSARFASGTVAVATAPAVPPSATKSASMAIKKAGVGRLNRDANIGCLPSCAGLRPAPRFDVVSLAEAPQETLKMRGRWPPAEAGGDAV